MKKKPDRQVNTTIPNQHINNISISNLINIFTRVTITGDGNNAVATANLSSNTIQNISLTNYGTGYTHANINIYGTATGANVANARAIIAPKYGHGYNSARELGGHNVMINVKIGDNDTTEGGLISANTSFRTYGFLRNPHKYGQNTAVTYTNSNSVISHVVKKSSLNQCLRKTYSLLYFCGGVNQ